MGIILGPVLRTLDMCARTDLIAYLVPRTLLYFSMVSLTAGPTGWFPRRLVRLHNISKPLVLFGRIFASTGCCDDCQGHGFLLPNSLGIWRELHRPEPDRRQIVRTNRINIRLAGTQGLLQLAIIFVMAKYVS